MIYLSIPQVAFIPTGAKWNLSIHKNVNFGTIRTSQRTPPKESISSQGNPEVHIEVADFICLFDFFSFFFVGSVRICGNPFERWLQAAMPPACCRAARSHAPTGRCWHGEARCAGPKPEPETTPMLTRSGVCSFGDPQFFVFPQIAESYRGSNF